MVHQTKKKKEQMKNQGMLNAIKAAGWNVVVRHRREYAEGKNWYFGLAQHGGFTECSAKKGDVQIVTTSKCHPKDSFTRKTGTNLAATRMIDFLCQIDPKLAIDRSHLVLEQMADDEDRSILAAQREAEREAHVLSAREAWVQK